MCEFKSALVLQSEEIITSPFTESHEDLIEIGGIKDNGKAFVRIEFVPTDNQYANIDKYVLKVDQEDTPDWWTTEVVERVTVRMRDSIRQMIVTEDKAVLVGGQYILQDCSVKKCKSCKIVAMLGSSNVGEMLDSSTVGEMLDSSNVGVMLGSSNVGVMRESSTVGVMRESSNVGVMRESSTVGEMLGSSNVGTMRDSSTVGEMLDSSNVQHDMREKNK